MGGTWLQYRTAGLLFLLLTACGAIVACSGSSSTANGPLPPASVTRAGSSSPISHVIVVIQENRSFDNLFATFPGANGTTVGLAKPMPTPVAQACANSNWPVITEPTTVPLTQVDLLGNGFPQSRENFANQDLAHAYKGGYLVDCDSAAGAPDSSNPCKMDAYDLSFTGPNGTGHPTCTYTYQYVNPNDIKSYWQLAQQYVLADNAFQTQGSESFTAHQELIAGGTAIDSKDSIIDDPSYFPWGCDGNPSSEVTNLLTIYGQYKGFQGPFPCLTYANGTIRDVLDAKKIAWKFYAQKVYPYNNPKNGGPGIWSAFDAVKAVRDSKEWGTKVTFSDLKIFSDIKAGRLPAVSWITPDAVNSDHPAEKKDLGPSWVAQIVNAVGTSKYWKSCAIVVLWDDAGGYYDHVAPPFYDNQGGLGFRFPMIIISPYVQAHVEHTQYETASVLRFIEDNWNLGTLGQEDKRATGIENAFNFSQTPRPFQTVSAKYSQSYFLNQKPSGIVPDSD
jgi:phospholipase C